MKLVFYSGGQNSSNRLIHKALGQLARKGKGKGSLSLTYIPVWSESSKVFFNRMVKRYRRVGFTRFVNLPVDQGRPSKELLKLAFKSDVVYLAGGNTFYSLKYLKESGVSSLFKRYAHRGGVIAGLSAGAIIMTPTIGLAAYPPFDADTNDVKLKRKFWKALGLVPFEFFPHFEETPRLNKAMASYSRRTGRPLYACKDGGGIVVDGKNLQFFGKVILFKNGQKFNCR